MIFNDFLYLYSFNTVVSENRGGKMPYTMGNSEIIVLTIQAIYKEKQSEAQKYRSN
jgi:hypothetical protein